MTRESRTFLFVIGVGGFLFGAGFLAGERSGESRAYGTVTSWQVERAGKVNSARRGLESNKSSLGPNHNGRL